MKKFIMPLCMLFLLLCAPVKLKASETDITEYEKEQLASILSIESEDIISVEIVYDFCNDPSFLLVNTAPDGYAIVFREFNIVSERSIGEGAANPYGTLDGKKYYAGPMNYFIYADDKYIDVIADKEINQNIIKQAGQEISRIINKLQDAQQISDVSSVQQYDVDAVSSFFDISLTISNAEVFKRLGFGHNVDDTCGPVAAQLLLSYYAVVDNKDFVRADWLSYTKAGDLMDVAEELHDEMIKRTKTVFGGTVPWTVADGINAYLKSSAKLRKLMRTANSYMLNAFEKIIDSLRSDNPCIILTRIAPGYDYEKHVMLAYGYKNYPFSTSFIVHTGWWNSPTSDSRTPKLDVEIHSIWVVGCVTIDSGPSDKLMIGKTTNLKTYVNVAKKAADNEWKSLNTSIATVTSTGTVKAVSSGRVSIIHNNKELNQQTRFVIYCYTPIKTLKITKLTKEESKALTVNTDGSGGGTIQLAATITPSDATYQTLSWVSSNYDVISVDSGGRVTATGFGKAKITAYDETGKKKVTISLSTKYNPDSIKFSETSKVLLAKKTYTPKVILTPKKNIYSNAKKDIVWTSSDTKVATVDVKGKVTTVSTGTATITATTKNGLSTSVEITVVVPPTSLMIKSISATEKILTIDENGSNNSTLQLERVFSPDNATDNFIWSSSDETVLSVDSSGLVTALKPGKAKITVTDGLKKKKAGIDLTVSHNPSRITLKDSAKTIKIGASYALTYTIEPVKTVATTAKDSLTWSSSDTDIATVDSKGKVTGISAGTVSITVKTQNGKTAEVKITVSK